MVSLVPSLTEAVAVTAPAVLAGATDYCTHPAGLDVVRVGGTKYPDLDRVLAAAPDLVLANAEENRREDVEALRAAGVPVWVTFPRTLDEALASLTRMLRRLDLADPPWLADARAAWAVLPASGPTSERSASGVVELEVSASAVMRDGSVGAAVVPGGSARRAVVPVWRRPWVVLGPGTFAGDLLSRLGVHNVYAEVGDADSGPDVQREIDRYPRPTLAELLARQPDLVVLPDEPYAFSAQDGPEAFPGVPCALVSGRHLTWYGPSLAEAPALLTAQLTDVVTTPAPPAPGG